ncbi:hypothetical protein SAMN05216226_101274 [Halovenus aranensis]|uniref:Uncharacterized protein n=1 Tax=Halovenus aranensis TaxID=890420 RepID=A0A1G8S426_9EURY|nr:hypothetical protein [Halovenus aranensis]SDJ23979.1 hypothetical protein SAMN05216226_101274 [Halovenus aranensis]
MGGAWEKAYSVSATGEEDWAEPLAIDAECWLGETGERPSEGGSKTVNKYEGGDVYITTNISDRSGVNQETYSCAYGLNQKITDISHLPEQAQDNDVFYKNEFELSGNGELGFTTAGYIIEGTDDAGNIGTSPDPEIPYTEADLGDETGIIDWNWYPTGEGGEFGGREGRNPINNLG